MAGQMYSGRERFVLAVMGSYKERWWGEGSGLLLSTGNGVNLHFPSTSGVTLKKLVLVLDQCMHNGTMLAIVACSCTLEIPMVTAQATW